MIEHIPAGTYRGIRQPERLVSDGNGPRVEVFCYPDDSSWSGVLRTSDIDGHWFAMGDGYETVVSGLEALIADSTALLSEFKRRYGSPGEAGSS